MSVYIQSRKIGRKRWETHIPPITRGFMVSAEDRAAKRLEELKRDGNPDREYRIMGARCRATGSTEPCRHHYAARSGQNAGSTGKCNCFESSAGESVK